MAITLATAEAQTVEKKGTTPYVTHFIFRPIMSIDIPGLGTATNLEAVGTVELRPHSWVLQSSDQSIVGMCY